MVEQSGNVTPGHGAKWVTNGVIADAGANPYSQRVLASLPNADFNSTDDQAILLPTTLLYFQLTGIIIAGATASLAVAVGGFYPEAFKNGSPIVSDTQDYTALTTPLLLMNATLTAYAGAQRFSRTQLPDWAIYFSLSDAAGLAATADIFLLGVELG